jgi:hypothetical protein
MIINIARKCRICDGEIIQIADLGEIHINDFPTDPNYSPGKAPLILDQCQSCTLVQLRHTIDPKILYGEHYWYQSGINPKLKQNLLDIADIANKHSTAGDIVLDIGANDGTLLSGVETSRWRVGCEPAPNLLDKLLSHCEQAIPAMWHHKYLNGSKAKVITAIGMFYDMDNPNEFINSVKHSLHHDGIFIAQLMTLAPMLRMRDLGNICHEHLEYYTYPSLVELYERNGLEIFHIEENDIQGGSYQIWARHLSVGSIEYTEDVSTLADFFKQIEQTGKKLRAVLKDFTDHGQQCYVYGASTKGNTMLQIWGLHDIFAGAAEIHPDKFGRYTVGTGIPIVPEDQAREAADVFFVPNFGFRELFIQKERDWLDNGGKMVFAMPEVDVV